MIAKLVTIVGDGMIYPLLVRVDNSFKDTGVEYFEMPDPFAEDNFKIFEKSVEQRPWHKEKHDIINISSKFTHTKRIVHNKLYEGDTDTFTFNYAPLIYNFTTTCLDLNTTIFKRLNCAYKDLNVLDKDDNPIAENVFCIFIEHCAHNQASPEDTIFKHVDFQNCRYYQFNFLDIPMFITRHADRQADMWIPNLKVVYQNNVKNIKHLYTTCYPVHNYLKFTCEKTGRKLIPYREATYLTSLYDYNKYEEMVSNGLLTKEELDNSYIYSK